MDQDSWFGSIIYASLRNRSIFFIDQYHQRQEMCDDVSLQTSNIPQTISETDRSIESIYIISFILIIITVNISTCYFV